MDLHFCTMNTPYSVGPDRQLTSGAEIQDRPWITAGPTMKEVAIVYSALDGGFPSPFALMFRADFFDDCSIDPASTGFYTTVNGVTVSGDQYVSEYTSYKFET